MNRLIALDLPGGDAFVATLQRLWDRGDAVLPLDQRLPPEMARQLLTTFGASAVVDAKGEHELANGFAVEPDDALVVATSGSTGDPKGVVLTHAAVAASAHATHQRLEVTTGDRWLACLPLAHVGGLSVVTRALLNDVALTVLPHFDAELVTSAARHGATLTSLVPTALSRIDPALFRRIVLGGSRPPADRPTNTVSTYGLTETGSGVVYDGVPLDGVEVEIAADGEILIRCAMQLRAYRDDSTPVDVDGWLHTNDAGRWLDDGRLFVDGRRGDMIISGGENIWPDRVEQALLDHPAVSEVAVAGRDDPTWGHAVVAFVVPSDPATPPTLETLRSFAKLSLPAFMAPHDVVIVDHLPRTTLGKLRRNIG